MRSHRHVLTLPGWRFPLQVTVYTSRKWDPGIFYVDV